MKENLDPNQILIAEFQYAAQTAQQANEDRGKVYELFLANIVTLISAAVLPGIINVENNIIFVLIFAALFFFGLVTLFQLAKTRVAWRSSVVAMNQIKDHYIENLNGLDKAFKWRGHTIPKNNSKWSVIFIQGLAVMSLNSLNLSAIIYFLFLHGFRLLFIPVLGVPFLVSAVVHYYIWERLLK